MNPASPTTQPARETPDAPPAPPGLDVPLPRVETTLDPQGALAKLDAAARKGKLPGLHPGGRGLFELEAFAQPFEGDVICTAAAVDGRTILSFQTRLRRKMPWVFGLILAFTIWPGVWFTESMLSTWFPSAQWLWGTTYWWYLILTVPTSPWYLWSAIGKSRRGAHASAHEQIREVATILQGRTLA